VWRSRGNRSTRRKPAPVPLCPPQIPYELTWARTRAAAVVTPTYLYVIILLRNPLGTSFPQWDFSLFSSVSLSKCLDNTSISPRPFLSKFFSIANTFIVYQFETTYISCCKCWSCFVSLLPSNLNKAQLRSSILYLVGRACCLIYFRAPSAHEVTSEYSSHFDFKRRFVWKWFV
jgi:hypothetical protein